MTRYRAFGLEVESSLELPGFRSGDPESPADVVIGRGAISDPPPDAVPVTRWATASPTEVWLSTPSADRFHVAEGERITIAPSPGTDDATLITFLLASGFGALLQQRGLLTLHAGSVATPVGAVGFLGRSGIGKSTVTSGLVGAGFRLVTDDILAIDRADAPRVIPAFPTMKVCRDVLDLRDGAAGYEALPSPREKFRVPAVHFSEAKIRLSGLYALRCDDGDEVTISEPVTRAAAFRILERDTFRRRFVMAMGRRAPHFHALTRVAAQVPMFVVTRPRAVDTHAQLLAAVQSHITVADATTAG